MMHGFSASREQEAGAGAYTAGVSLADAMGAVLRRHATLPLTTAELRVGLRPIVARAHAMDATVEQLLVSLKRAWAELPEVRATQADRAEASRRLGRAVTTLIELYFER
jgi:hypothetical protein